MKASSSGCRVRMPQRSYRPSLEALENRLPPGDTVLEILFWPLALFSDRDSFARISPGESLSSLAVREAFPPPGRQALLTWDALSQGSLMEPVPASPARVSSRDAASSNVFVANLLAGDFAADPFNLLAAAAAAPEANQLAGSRAAPQDGGSASFSLLAPPTRDAAPREGGAQGIGLVTMTSDRRGAGGSAAPSQDGKIRAQGHSAPNPIDSLTDPRPNDGPVGALAASGLPSPWMSRDIGYVGVAGTATQANNLYTLQGSGSDIFDTHDAFQFVYQPLRGDGEMAARVLSVQNTDAWAKAGVMIRESLSPHAAHAMIVLTPAQGSSFQYRISTAGTTNFTNPADPTFRWVRVVRSGNTFTGYRSGNGHDWIQAGSVTIAMGSTVYAGLAVTAHNNSQLNTSAFDHVTASVRSPFTWNTVTPLPFARFEAQSATVNGQLYVMGGYYTDTDAGLQATTEMDVYDPGSNTWAELSDVPLPLTHSGTAVDVDGQAIYLAGGFVGDGGGPVTNRVLKYTISSDTWSDAPPLPEARGAGALVRIDRTLHFFGGQDATHQMNRGDHWVLNLNGGTAWKPAADLPNPRDHLGYTDLNGKAYAVGGQHLDEFSTNQAEVDAYDPATNTWAQVAPLPVPTAHNHNSTFVLNGRIVVAGGETNGARFLADVREYDPATNIWVALPPLPAPRQAGDAGQIGGRIYFTGGRIAFGTISNTTWSGGLVNTWEAAASMPVALGEVAGGVIGNTLFLVGEGNSATLAYDLPTGTWRSTGLLTRPFVGNHHAAEVYNGKLYLLGGLGGNSGGKVQIYDPVLNNWILGTDMPFAAGSSSSALINGEIYVAGGIIGSSTTDQVAMYDPPSDRWTMLSPMPQGRNHAASATDGSFLYVFGGRIGPNAVANGFDTVEIYDPATDTWDSSDSSPRLAPLPQARGGMGKAVYYHGEFYVLGGETLDGSLATPENVYNRVDIYDPGANVWRQGPIMPTARHGVFPLLATGRIYVAGGGIHSAGSQSAILEVLNADLPGAS